MDATASTLGKDDLLGQVFSVCTTLTEEAMAVATAKVVELGFDPDRGLVPLRESAINLSVARAVLEDAIEKQKLVQLPITVQKELLANLEGVSRSLQGLTSGVDDVVNLTNAIEVLNTTIWKYGLHNLSDQILGHQRKLNQLKDQEVQVSRLLSGLTEAQRTAEQAKTSAATIEEVKQAALKVEPLLTQVTAAGTQVATLLVSIQQNEKQSGELAAAIKTRTTTWEPSTAASESSTERSTNTGGRSRKPLTQRASF